MVAYDDLNKIPSGSVVRYKEYKLEMNEKLTLIGEIEGIMLAHIEANSALSADEIRSYYNLSGNEGLQPLSKVTHRRIVLQVGNTQQGVPIYTTINLNSYFMSVGQQVVEYEQYVQPQPEKPIDILGFNSYDFGAKFKT